MNMVQTNHIGSHEYSFSEGIFSFAPRGMVRPEHAAQLVVLLEQYGRPGHPLVCLFDLSGSPDPAPAARRVVIEFFRRTKPQLFIATHGAPLHLRAMLALVSAAARVVGGYHLNVAHFARREEARQFLRQTLAV